MITVVGLSTPSFLRTYKQCRPIPGASKVRNPNPSSQVWSVSTTLCGQQPPRNATTLSGQSPGGIKILYNFKIGFFTLKL